MIIGDRISDSHFFPILFENEQKLDLKSISSCFSNQNIRNNVVFLLNRKRDKIDIDTTSISAFFIVLKNNKRISNEFYMLFKQLITNLTFRNYDKQMIAIVSFNNVNLIGYCIVRWLVEEKSMYLEDAIDLFNNLRLKSQISPKYIEKIKPYINPKKIEKVIDVPTISIPKTNTDSAKEAVIGSNPVHASDIDIKSSTIEGVLMEVSIMLNRLCVHVPKMMRKRASRINVREFISNFKDSPICVVPEPRGYRSILVISGSRKTIVFCEHSIMTIDSYFPSIHNSGSELSNCIIEGVFVERPTKNLFIICDIMCLEGVILLHHTFIERYGIIQNEIVNPRKSFVSNFSESIDFYLRPCFKFEDYRYVINAKYPYDVKGFSLIPIHSLYCLSKSESINNVYYSQDLDLPVVIVKIEFGANQMFGCFYENNQLTPYIDLGSMNKENIGINGSIARINRDSSTNKWEIVETDIIGTPWTKSKFLRKYESDIFLDDFVQLLDEIVGRRNNT